VSERERELSTAEAMAGGGALAREEARRVAFIGGARDGDAEGSCNTLCFWTSVNERVNLFLTIIECTKP
jgi:hypothetical protein